jgi:hypothetical protein
MDLGAAASGKGAKKDEVILAVPTEEKDINALYADELKLLAEPIPIVKPTRSKTQKQEDYYKVSPSAVPFRICYTSDTHPKTNTDFQNQRLDGMGAFEWSVVRGNPVSILVNLPGCTRLMRK